MSPGSYRVFGRGPRPWTVHFREERGWYLEDAEGRPVAMNFRSLFDALSWAVGR